MMILQDTPMPLPEPSVATIGFFDGVHCGHRFLIRQLSEHARQEGLKTAVVTFPIPPRQVIRPDDSFELLTTFDEKIDLLQQSGLDYAIVLNFTQALSQLTAYEFMAVLREQYNVRILYVGHDHRFGHNRNESFRDYVRFGKALDMKVVRIEPFAVAEGDTAASSSRIRHLLHKGRIDQANLQLGYPFFLIGKVVDGHKLGRKLGFPTANVHVEDTAKLIPADGIYVVSVEVGGTCYGGMLSIGLRPTVSTDRVRSIEVHIFQFSADIYGQTIRLSLLHYLRPERKFAHVEDLVRRMQQDQMEAESYLKKGLSV